ncbi:MAG: hypothetical protein GX077_00940 [Tissierellia bacterium]|nr:hypothetical protein [Tissierellia bacterium]
MKKIPDINVFNKWHDYYESEDLMNTDFSNLDHLNPRRPDAYINLTNNIFTSSQYYFNDPDEIHDFLDWY